MYQKKFFAISTTYFLFLIGGIEVLASSLKCLTCAGFDPNCTGNKTNLPVMDCDTLEISGPPLSTLSLEGKTKEIVNELESKLHINMSLSTKMVCLKYTFDHDDFPQNTRMIVRTCAPEKIMEQDVCRWGNSFISLLNAEPGDCSTCDEWYCNAGHRPEVFSFIKYVFVFLALLFHGSIA